MANLDDMAALDILGTRVHALTLENAVRRMIDAATARRPMTVCPRDAHGIIRARTDRDLQRAHQAADMITADGIPLVWLQRMAGLQWAERVYGPDLMDRVCDKGLLAGLRHAVLGGRPGVAETVADRLSKKHPGLNVVLASGLPMRGADHRPVPGEDSGALAALAKADADVLWLSLGSPRQELWLHANQHTLPTPVRVGVGAAFDFIAGTVPQAPPSSEAPAWSGCGACVPSLADWGRATRAPSRRSCFCAP